MENPVNPKEIYYGECLGCTHLHRMNQFSTTWYCDLEHKPNDNGKSWRENGKKMQKCSHFTPYKENRCVDCLLAYSTSSKFWHCRLDNHCFNYTDSACKHFNGSQEDYIKEQQIAALKFKIDTLLEKRKSFCIKIEEIDQNISELNKSLHNLLTQEPNESMDSTTK